MQRFAKEEKRNEEIAEESSVNEIDGMKVLSKKQNNFAVTKKEKPSKKKNETRFVLPMDVLRDMYQLKVAPPATVEGVAESLVQIRKRIEEFGALRDKAVAEFDPEAVLKEIRENEEVVEPRRRRRN